MPRMKSAHRRPRRHRSQFSRRNAVLGVVVLLGVILAAIWYFNSQASPPAEIGAEEAHRRVEQGAFLLDVRRQEEWQEIRVPGATLIPLDELAGRLDEVPRDREVVVICRSGNRSQQGRDLLLESGFDRVTSVQGGITAWQAAGFPVELGQP